MFIRLLNNKSIQIFSKKSNQLWMILLHLFSGVPCLISCAIGRISTQSLRTPDMWWGYFLDSFPRDQVGDLMLYCLDHGPYRGFSSDLCACDGIKIGSIEANIFFASVVTSILTYALLVVGGSWYVYYCLKKQAKLMTKKNYKNESKLVVALFMQAFIPFICLVIPYIFSVIHIAFDLRKMETLTTVLFQISTLHSFFNATTMTLLIKPYREAVKNVFLLKGWKYQPTHHAAMPNGPNRIHQLQVDWQKH
uniref:Uncharacterized protein n=1 Tax=Acrobeloides nanus TaxID=290746 RepID=A0A914D0L8_9BILA